MLKLLLLCMFLCTMPLKSIAQGHVPASDEEEVKFKAENFGFNAIDLHQKRFLYGDSIVYDSIFHDVLSVGVLWRYNKIHKFTPQGYEGTLNYGVFVEKELSKLHALSLSLSGGSYQHIARLTVLNMCQVELRHSFNWIRFFGGYNPYRKIEVVTNLGVGAFCSSPNFFKNFPEAFSDKKQIEMGPQLTMGAGMRLLLNPLFVLGIDPYVTLATDNIDHSGRLNLKKYDVLYGTNVSLSYTFRNELTKEERGKYSGNTLVDFGLGVQLLPTSGYLPVAPSFSSLPLLATAGPQLRFGIGHWFGPAVALRATGNLSSSDWLNTHLEADSETRHPSYDIRLRNVLMNARLDLLFSPYRFFSGKDENRFDINTIVGWEYGRIIKTAYNPDNLLRTNYNGFSGGLQFRYIQDKHTSLYLEPRITFANYIIPSNYDNDEPPPLPRWAKRYRDCTLSMTAGMEFSTNEHSFKSGEKQPSTFTPHMALSLQGGPNYLFTTREHVGKPHIDFGGGLSAELLLSPYSGVRLMADYSQVSHRDIYRYTQIGSENHFGSQPLLSDTALCTGRYGYLNISADYIFDLGTLLQGYNKANRWDVALAFGLVSSTRVSYKALISKDEKLWEFRGDKPAASVPEVDHSRATRHALGLQFGIPVSYRVAPHLHVLFEPRARFFSSKYIQQTHSQGVTKILNAQLGVRYTFDDSHFVQDMGVHIHELNQDRNYRHDFINLSIGTQHATGTKLPFGSTGGLQLGLGVGRWMNPLWGLRLGTEMAASHLNAKPEAGGNLLLKSARFGGRIDIMANPLALGRNYTNRFGTALLLGWEVGGKVDAMHSHLYEHVYHSFSAGAQLRYHTDEKHAFYIEPRYMIDDKLVSLTAGLEYAINENRFRASKNQPGEFKPYFNVGAAGGATYRFLTNMYEGLPQLGINAGISGEYHFTPYSGARLTADYAEITNGGQFNGKAIRIGHINTGLDYMFDLSTLFTGYTANRRLDLSLAAGPVFSTNITTNKAYASSLKKFTVGMQVGAPVQLNINRNWGISLEPRAHIFFNDNYAGINGGRNLIMNVQMGMKYTF